MNGRMYDPELGRFISADPNVQFIKDTQSYNRYSYVHNNPLRYSDPTGYFVRKLLRNMSEIGFYFAASNYEKSWDYTKPVLQDMSPGAAGAIGFVLNFVPGVGPALSAAFNAAYAIANGATFGQGVAIGGVSFLSSGMAGNGMVAQVIGAGFAGGLTAEATGGDFSEGFMKAATGAAVMAALMWAAQAVPDVTGTTNIEHDTSRMLASADDDFNQRWADSVLDADSTDWELRIDEHLGDPTGNTREILVDTIEVDRFEPVLNDAVDTAVDYADTKIPKSVREAFKRAGRLVGPAVGNQVGDVRYVDTAEVYQPQQEFNRQNVYYDYNPQTGATRFIGTRNDTTWINSGSPRQEVISSRQIGVRWWHDR
jgi:hypothetical protein